jgi:hypothetical protein
LPEMLDLAGAPRLAATVREHHQQVEPAIEQVVDLLRQAQTVAADMKVAADAAAASG